MGKHPFVQPHFQSGIQHGVQFLKAHLIAQSRKIQIVSQHGKLQRRIYRVGSGLDALFDAGMSYCLSQIIDLLVNDISGIHLYTMNNPLVARRICEGIKNIV